MIWRDRVEAGLQLADALKQYDGQPNVVVLGLPRGGVVTAAAVAHALQAPLDVVITRKLGAAGNAEYATGALTEQGTMVGTGTTAVITQEQKELERRIQMYRQNRLPLPLRDKTVMIVDDGIATGLTMHAAIQSVRERQPAKIVVAVPVAPPDTIAELSKTADDVVVLDQPDNFMAVGQFYQEFDQVTDEQVQYHLVKYGQNT